MASIDDEKTFEKDFVDSWNRVEKSLALYMYPDHISTMMVFIATLRAEGYDKVFRAGQSVGALMLSRSKVHGLRDAQAFLRFRLYPHHNSFPRETATLHFGMTVLYYPEYVGDITQERTYPDVDSVTQVLEANHTKRDPLITELFLEEVTLTKEVKVMLLRLAAQPID